jgi:arsenate reductase-like glutaredoxin family protein
MDDFQTEYETLRENLKTIDVRMRLLFEEHFEFVNYKKQVPHKEWIDAKMGITKCAVGELLQTQTSLYRRIK